MTEGNLLNCSDRQFFNFDLNQMQNYLENELQSKSSSIASKDISVIIQGPIFNKTHPLAPSGITFQVVSAIRNFLPEANIILATWKGQDTQGIDVDTVMYLDDPGTTNFYRDGAQTNNLYNNSNRLIYSTQQGLSKVTTRYTLKIRSDLLMFHALFVNFFNIFNFYDNKWKVLQNRILAFPLYSLKFEDGVKDGQQLRQVRPFHVSDWVYFGLTEDLRKLFECKLLPEPQTSRWFENRPKPDNDLWPDRLWRYSPEQYITSNLAHRTLGIMLEHASVEDNDIIEASERFIANNFIIIDQKQWGLYSLKLENYQDELDPNILSGIYSHNVWRDDYKKYSY